MSTYLHLMVCWLEVDALRRVLGRLRGDRVTRRLSETGVYRWVYRTVLEEYDELGLAYMERGLVPPTEQR